MEAVREVELLKDFDLGIKDIGPYPPMQWLMQILSTYEPDHKFFKKDYYPPPRPSKSKSRNTIDNSSGIFTDLPPQLLHQKVKRQTGRGGFLKV
jgi:hypothetical protein